MWRGCAGEAQRAAYVIALGAKWSARMRSKPWGTLLEQFTQARRLLRSAPAPDSPNEGNVACRCTPPPFLPLYPCMVHPRFGHGA